MKRLLAGWSFGLLSLSPLLAAPPAEACSTCSVGDPTLTAMGEEQPFAGRVRASTTVRAWGEDAAHVHGADGHHIHSSSLRELRLDVGVNWSPTAWLSLGIGVPLQLRALTNDGHSASALGAGDADLAARWVVWRDRSFSSNHLLSVIAGVKLPTAPMRDGPDGKPLPLQLQTGTGSIDPRLGVGWTFFSGQWSTHTQLIAQTSTLGFDGYRMGPSLRARAAVQLQPSSRWGLRLGAEGRLLADDSHHGIPVAGTGGPSAWIIPGAIWSPSTDVTFQLDVHAPAYSGEHSKPLPTVMLGAVFDF